MCGGGGGNLGCGCVDHWWRAYRSQRKSVEAWCDPKKGGESGGYGRGGGKGGLENCGGGGRGGVWDVSVLIAGGKATSHSPSP